MQLQELLDAGPLKVSVLYADADDLRREFTWTYTTDLIDPRRYLSRGQLLLTGLVWHDGPASSDTFVGRAVEAGAAALLVGDARHGYVPDDVISACRRYGLPLLLVPRDVSFAAVTAFVSNAQAATRVRQLAAGLVRQRELLLDVYRGQMLGDLVERIAGDLGRPLWVISASGRTVASSAAPLPDLARDEAVAVHAAGGPSPALVRDETSGEVVLTVFVIETVGDHPATAWLLVTEGDWRQWDPAILDVVRELSSVVGLYRVQHRAHVQEQANAATRVIELIAGDDGDPELMPYLRQAGIEADGRTIVVAAEFVGEAGEGEASQQLALDVLADAAGHVAPLGQAVVGRDADDRAIALIPVAGDGAGLPAEVTGALQRIAGSLDAALLLR
ncbi:PucR family transcriptional regulator ligand-binding domain-containing protein, partial [Microbacterium sp.]|uniref:PucR family transcriptional regulator ligand-binding domain-containing protein n=1 Tax=Microbacterium sp. TaxID=51671 RepID=UPI003C714805